MAEADIMQGTRFDDHGTRKEIKDIAAAGDVPLGAQGAPMPGAPMVSPGQGGPQSLGMPPPNEALRQMPTDDAPITSGLSVGPGNTPPTPMHAKVAAKLSRIEKLAALASMAKSPHIRYQAQAAIKLMLRGGEGEDG